MSGSLNVVSAAAARSKCTIAPRASNCANRSRPAMNSWYAGKVGGWLAVVAQRLSRESNSVASVAMTRWRSVSTAISGCANGAAIGSSARSTRPSSVERPAAFHADRLRGRDLHLEPNAVALLVVATRDDGTRARRAPERADRGRVAQAGGLARVHRRRHHGDRGDDFDNAGLRQSLRHPIGRHEAEVVERWIAGAILHHGDRHATLVHGKGRVPQHDGCGRDAEDRDNAGRRNQPAPPPTGEDTARRRAHAVAGPAERRYERLRGRKAFVRQRRDRLRHDVFHRARHARRRPTQRRARFQRRPVVDQPFVERHNRRLSREHLEQHAAQAVHVAARVGRHPEGLLGTHVSRRSDGLTRLGDRQVAGGTDRARDAEIGDHGVIRREQDVFRLDVAVDDALRVGERERVSHVGGDVQCRFERQASFAQQPVPQ